MERRLPKLKNNIDIPVIIFEGEKELKECDTVKEAAYWLRDHIGHKFLRFKVISEGIRHGNPYDYNGVTYYFTSDPEAVKRRWDGE
ncbi:hypothetical protein [Peribacillus butanolivorans]|uniref:hypothetical protein n=1 Tax=Peribacillus butanolivorans TaxID=421767 RepID=UPI00366C0857